MSSAESRISLSLAETLADKIKAELEPACEQLVIAGSVRRQRETCGDIEIVCIPKLVLTGMVQPSLFGEAEPETVAVNLLDQRIEELLQTKHNFSRADKNGPKQKSFWIESLSGTKIKLELWLATPDNFGLILMIRTGPWEFSKRAVTPTDQRTSEGWPGLLKVGHRSSGGMFYNGLAPISVPDEELFMMTYLSCGWLEPAERSKFAGFTG